MIVSPARLKFELLQWADFICPICGLPFTLETLREAVTDKYGYPIHFWHIHSIYPISRRKPIDEPDFPGKLAH